MTKLVSLSVQVVACRLNASEGSGQRSAPVAKQVVGATKRRRKIKIDETATELEESCKKMRANAPRPLLILSDGEIDG